MVFPNFWQKFAVQHIIQCYPIFWHVKWNDMTVGMWHQYCKIKCPECDMNTLHVTWVHDLWHGYITFDRIVMLVKELFRTIRSIWVARYFTLLDLCHDMWHNTWYVIWHDMSHHITFDYLYVRNWLNWGCHYM